MTKVNSKLIAARNSITVFLALFLFLGIGIFGCSGSSTNTTPIVFVHGYAGSADQFESQALRFASNGYPASYISGYEYDTTLVTGNPTDGFKIPPEILSGLDVYISSVLEKTGADKVDLLGHSMGTAVSHAYLAFPSLAAKIAHYVNIDGQQSATPPGGVPTLALWAELSVPNTVRSIGGATNITLTGTTHVQAATSVESFEAMYKFFQNNKAPSTTDILSERSNTINLSGRVVTFLTNAVPADLTLDIYEVTKDTGVRINTTPDYSTTINPADGNFIFTNATSGKNYEFHLTSTTNTAVSGHYYYEPFIRNDSLIRLKYIEPSNLGLIIDQNADHSDVIVIRNKEFLGVSSMSPNEDSLKVKDTELCAGVLPKTGGLGTPISLFIFDKGSNGLNDLSGPITSGIVSILPFVSGLDFYMQAANPPNGTISIVLEGRNSGKTQTINVPNWPSTVDIITVQMMDY